MTACSKVDPTNLSWPQADSPVNLHFVSPLGRDVGHNLKSLRWTCSGQSRFPSGRSRQRIDEPPAPRGGIQFYPVKPDGPVWLALPSGAPLDIPSPREFPFLATNRAHECLTKQGNASCRYSVFGSLSAR
jgi:hypothetical protein